MEGSFKLSKILTQNIKNIKLPSTKLSKVEAIAPNPEPEVEIIQKPTETKSLKDGEYRRFESYSPNSKKFPITILKTGIKTMARRDPWGTVIYDVYLDGKPVPLPKPDFIQSTDHLKTNLITSRNKKLLGSENESARVINMPNSNIEAGKNVFVLLAFMAMILIPLTLKIQESVTKPKADSLAESSEVKRMLTPVGNFKKAEHDVIEDRRIAFKRLKQAQQEAWAEENAKFANESGKKVENLFKNNLKLLKNKTKKIEEVGR